VRLRRRLGEMPHVTLGSNRRETGPVVLPLERLDPARTTPRPQLSSKRGSIKTNHRPPNLGGDCLSGKKDPSARRCLALKGKTVANLSRKYRVRLPGYNRGMADREKKRSAFKKKAEVTVGDLILQISRRTSTS